MKEYGYGISYVMRKLLFSKFFATERKTSTFFIGNAVFFIFVSMRGRNKKIQANPSRLLEVKKKDSNQPEVQLTI